MTDRRHVGVGTRSRRVPTPGGPPRWTGHGVRQRLEQGAVTAEAAMVLPVLVATVMGLVWGVSLAVAQVRATDAAREVARAVARDDPTTAALARGRAVAPPGARITVAGGQEEVVATVTAEVAGPGGLWGFLPEVTVGARAVAAAEIP